MSRPLVTINLVVHDGEKYIRRCLDSVLNQTYPHENIELNILDNNSTDLTAQKINNRKPEIANCKFRFNFIQTKSNLGMWPGQEKLLEYSHGKYVVVLSVDIILHSDFVKNAVRAIESDPGIGALQPKIYKYELPGPKTGDDRHELKTDIIDTAGFEIYRSRRVINAGHGEKDKGQFSQSEEIFAVEGATPLFRREALEDCRLKSQNNKIVDPDFFWYGDDLDLAWRLRLFGWKQIFEPAAIAYHDRQTTKTSAGGKWKEFVKIRKAVPIKKRRLDWRNTTLAIIKNDFGLNFWHDFPFIFWRQFRLWTYFLLFEPSMLIELADVAKLLPKMLKRRREIMRRTKVSAQDFRHWLRSD